jgi:hypothetical protein
VSFDVRPYSGEYVEAWEGLLTRAHNATIFHDLRFLSYHPEGKYRTCHLLFFEGERLISGMPAAIAEENGIRILRSPYGASWGGLLLPSGLGAREVFELVQSMIAFARDREIERIEIVLPPPVYLERQDQVQEFCLLAAGFGLAWAEVTEVIHLSDFLESSLSSPYRRGVHKAKRKGVTVQESKDLRSFHRLLLEDRAEKGATPTHSLADLSRIDALVPGRLVLFTASAGSDLLGGALLFAAGPRTILNMYLCQTAEAKSLRVANLLVYETAIWARTAGFAYYDMGTSSILMKPNWGLTRFKEGFIGRGYLRPTFAYGKAKGPAGQAQAERAPHKGRA